LIKTSTPPSLRFLFSHPAHLVACGFGSGLSPFAPGTVGTLFAWLTFPLLRPWMNDAELLAFLPSVHRRRAGGALDRRRPRRRHPATSSGTRSFRSGSFPSPALAVAGWPFLFRGFDIFKPQPARYSRENGFGVMTDDLVAAGYTVQSSPYRSSYEQRLKLALPPGRCPLPTASCGTVVVARSA
jgi:phosphatidylglycerophosphatase A